VATQRGRERDPRRLVQILAEPKARGSERHRPLLQDFDRALIILSPEQTERTFFYEFRWDEEQDEILVGTSESELNWMRY
jgi:hypothetical protein